jgi:hypothetical protein
MKPRFAVLWRSWLPAALLAVACAAVISAWLEPQNIVSWLMLSSFCT